MKPHNDRRSVRATTASVCVLVALATATDCGARPGPTTDVASVDASGDERVAPATDAGASGASLPLVPVADVELPGGATRWDYQEIDAAHGHLVIAHMGDNEVVIVSLADGAVAGRVPGVGTVRGIAIGEGANLIFATAASTSQLVIIDAVTLTETARVATGNAPDGVAWDGVHQIVGVSDQRAGALSLLAGAGRGAHTQVPLGTETGNVTFDRARSRFWITVVRAGQPDQLVAVDPTSGAVTDRIDLPGCNGAHGLRLHPDGQSALIACEDNDTLARVDLGGAHAVVTAPTGAGPDVLSIDTGLDWLYVAAESGDLTVFDLNRVGLVNIDGEHPGDNAHTVAADPTSHRVYFPLVSGPSGRPVLRIMRPAGV